MWSVYVVSFAPSSEHHGVGGFDWYANRNVAEEAYKREVMESARHGGSHIVRLVPFTTWDFDLRNEHERVEVTGLIDARLDKVESELSPLRQYIPPNTEPGYLPVNTRTRR